MGNISSENGKGTKEALLLAERAVQMFDIQPAVTSLMGEAASAPQKFEYELRKETLEGEGELWVSCSKIGLCFGFAAVLLWCFDFGRL